ncbi:hypothetical protein LHJ74_03235 [Streptomyces sp. N2-109]|uniref:Lipoprotein n=1 Tax=Streptomyces gossypii TaxID=2883101 RepID=A0ABT2JM44_9ACTN|nr:hypothetical protein [Streptomyces gossypii]MCT2588957.1 hypothetical protein [Streptomyces gossypii]
MLDVSDDVRSEIGDAEAARLLAGENSPGSYDCTSCRTPGDTGSERTSTVLFLGEETALLAFAHATCIPSQVVKVSEEQLQGAVRTITGDQQQASGQGSGARPAVLSVTCGQVLIDGTLHPAVVVEPNSAISRPGSTGPGDDFLPLLIEQGFRPVFDLSQAPETIEGWSVLMAMGQLHGILQPSAQGHGQPTSWWQAHQPLPVTDGWRVAANKSHTVLVYAAPTGSIGQQPREDLLREALERAAANGSLVAGAMPLTGT